MGILTKVGFYLIGAIVAAGLVLGAYQVWKRGVIAEATQKIVIAQLEQALAEAAKSAEELKRIQAMVDQLSADLRKQKAEVDAKLSEVEAAIDAGVDRESSDVLKDTVKKLGGQ